MLLEIENERSIKLSRYLVCCHKFRRSVFYLARQKRTPLWLARRRQGRNEGRYCLAHVKEVWVDMRPRSLKEAMAAQAQALDP